MLRMTEEQYAAMTGRQPEKGNKYHAHAVVVDGVRYASQHEYARWCELRQLQRVGLIFGLRRQVAYELAPKSQGRRAVKYVADAVYIEDGRIVVEDAKGIRTAVYKLKKRLMWEKYGIEIKEV